MTITKKDALNTAIELVEERIAFYEEESGSQAEAKVGELKEKATILSKMIAQLSKPRSPMSDEAKAKQNELRKAKTAAARSELVAKVAPIIRAAMTTEPQTAKEIFAKCVGLPEDFTAAKVQNVLLRELRDSITVIEAKGKANTYNL